MKLLRISFLLAIPLALAACSTTPQCMIKGTVTSDLDTVWLYDMEQNPIDSCTVQNGTFTFTCDRNTASVVTI